MTTPTIFPQSHSSLGCFETCPAQYEAKYILKLECMQFQETDATRWGNAVHKMLELAVAIRAARVADSITPELDAAIYAHPRRYKTNVPITNYLQAADMANAVMNRGGLHPIIEQSYAIRRDGTTTSYWAKDAWQRSKIDLLMLGTTHAIIWDWKTGKPKDDPKQLELYALMAFAAYPELAVIHTGYVWLGDDGKINPDKPKTYRRSDVPALMLSAQRRYTPLEQAYATGMFPPKPSGLCNGWCQLTSCPHWKPKKEKR